MVKKKSEESILFPEKVIAGITVAPWTFGNLFSIADPLERILDKVESAGMADKLIDTETGDLQLDYFSLARLFTMASNELLLVIASTLEVDEETVRDLPITDGITIVLLMFNQNKEMVINALKNAMSPPPTELAKKVQKKKAVGPKTKKNS